MPDAAAHEVEVDHEKGQNPEDPRDQGLDREDVARRLADEFSATVTDVVADVEALFDQLSPSTAANHEGHDDGRTVGSARRRNDGDAGC